MRINAQVLLLRAPYLREYIILRRPSFKITELYHDKRAIDPMLDRLIIFDRRLYALAYTQIIMAFVLLPCA